MRLYPALTIDEEFQTLRAAGRTGSLNDMIVQHLRADGGTGTIGDMLKLNSGGSFSIIGDGTGSYVISGGGSQVTISGVGVPFDGTFDLPTPPLPDYIVAPYVTGTEGVGDTRTVNQGLIYRDDTDTVTSTITLKRDGTAFVTDAALTNLITESYDYTVLVGDDNGGVTAEVTITDGTTSNTVTLDVVVDATVPAVVSTANVSPTTLTDPDGDGKNYELYEWTATDPDITFSSGGLVQILAVGSGGGGGSRGSGGAQGGGGGGQVEEDLAFSVPSGNVVGTIGAPGQGAGDDGSGGWQLSTEGGDIVFNSLTLARGGGKGATADQFFAGVDASTRATGGGSNTLTSFPGTSGEGEAGGVSNNASAGSGAGGGGGGAGGVGGDATGNLVPGVGGLGLTSDITGSTVTYGEGGTGGQQGGVDKTPLADGTGRGGDGNSGVTGATGTERNGQDGSKGTFKLRVEVA